MDEPTSSKQPSFTRALPRPDTSNEKEVIDSIESSFFIDDEDFDAIAYELKKLDGIDNLCVNDVDRERIRLKSQLLVVSKKISTLILEKAPSYSSNMDDLAEIQKELGEVIQRVKTVRRYLGECKSKSNYALSVLVNDRKKGFLLQLKEALQRIKTLHETEYRIHEFLEQGEFPLAIRVCREAMDAAQEYSHYDCVRELSTKLSACSNLLENALDSALSSLICSFDPDRYLLVYGAYRMLGKVEDAASRLVTLACAALERRARQVLIAEVIQHEPSSNTDTLAYEKLCEIIPCDRVAETLRVLGFALCQILTNVHAVIALHTEEDEREKMVVGEEYEPSIISRTLSSSLYTIFRTALVRFNTLLCCHDFGLLKFDDILTAIELASRFRSFGRLHFGHSGMEICVSLEKQSVMFFSRQHAEKMEELKMFLENEAFAVCPLPDNFCLFDLQEFAFLKGRTHDSLRGVEDEDNGIGEQLDFTLISSDSLNPFDSTASSPRKVRSTTVSQNGTPCPDTVDTPSPSSTTTFPNLCNAALVVLRLLGRYIRMTSLLHSIVDRSIPAITELFQYFMFAMVEFFARDGTEFVEPITPRLDTVLKRIDRSLFCNDTSVLQPPSLSSAVQLQFADRLFALPERLVAIDSLEFVARQLDLTRPVVESLLRPEDDKSATVLADFYTDVLRAVPDVRQAIMSAVASRALKIPLLISTISTTQWNVNELQSRHSTYIDFLEQDLEVFSLRLQHVMLDQPCDESLKTLLWDQTTNVAIKAILHGYGQIGARCSNEGRALMQLDMQHLSGRMEKLTGKKMTEAMSIIDAYVKAYYLPEKHLEVWALSHPEYTKDQVASLLAAATHVSKKTKTRIINALASN